MSSFEMVKLMESFDAALESFLIIQSLLERSLSRIVEEYGEVPVTALEFGYFFFITLIELGSLRRWNCFHILIFLSSFLFHEIQ